MRIGLVCEGSSDVPAIIHFVGDQLKRNGLQPVFRNLFPEPDRTRQDAGWSNLLLWLKNNPANARIARYFSQGLFGGDAAQLPLDAIVIHIDADVVEEHGFRAYVEKNFGLIFRQLETPSQRGQMMALVVNAACENEMMTEADRQRHVVAVAVESTETWCLAAFRAQPDEFEKLRGSELTNAFMQALEISESRRPEDVYANCDKNADRRDRFCATYTNHSDRIVGTCPHFDATIKAVLAVAP